MSLILRQSTAKAVSFGPFLDKTDGVTLEVGLVSAIDHATTGILLSKNGGALTIRSQAVTASTYDAYGNYIVTLSTTDTNTVGTLRMQFSEAATCLPVWQDFIVVEEAVYDALFAASAAGYQVPIWAAVGSTVNLSATTIKTATDVETDTADIQTRIPAALTANGNMKSSLMEILTTALTETAGLLAAGFKKFFNVATPTGTLNSLPDAVPGAAGGVSTLVAADVTAAVPTAIQNADQLLKRDWTAVTGEAARSTLNALRFLRNKWSISAGTLTVTAEDDTTSAWTATVTTAAGNPVDSIDPA